MVIFPPFFIISVFIPNIAKLGYFSSFVRMFIAVLKFLKLNSIHVVVKRKLSDLHSTIVNLMQLSLCNVALILLST